MGWTERQQRRTAIKAVLEYTAAHPGAGLPFEQLPEVRAVFRSRRELLQALQYEWSQALWGSVEVLSLDPTRADLPAYELARRAWNECTTRRPELRRLLDRHRGEVARSARASELPVSAGLGTHADQEVYRPAYA